MRLPRLVLQHTIRVEGYLGESAGGTTYGEPVEVPCLFEGKTETKTAADGAAFTSAGTALCDLDQLEHFPVGSRATAPDGRVVWVRLLEPHDPGRLPLPASLTVTFE